MNSRKTIIGIITGIITLWAISALLLFLVYDNQTDRGAFGDMFGAVNALFSGLALAGVIYTIFLQSKELSLQREEIKQTRNVFEKQQFESTFFQLLNLLERNLQNVEAHITTRQNGEITKEKTHYGQNAMFKLRGVFNRNYISPFLNTNKKDIPSLRSKMKEYFEIDRVNELSKYFDTLKNIMLFVESSSTPVKGFYFKLIHNQISPIEKYNIMHYLLKDEKFYNIVVGQHKEMLIGIPEYYFDNEQHLKYYKHLLENEPNSN